MNGIGAGHLRSEAGQLGHIAAHLLLSGAGPDRGKSPGADIGAHYLSASFAAGLRAGGNVRRGGTQDHAPAQRMSQLSVLGNIVPWNIRKTLA
jgi:hypothetical protein